MTDTAFDNAKAKHDALKIEKDKLEQRLKEIQSEMRDVASFMQQWQQFAYGPHSTQLSSVPVTDTKSQVAAKNPKKEFVAERARDVIREAGKPLPRSELFKELQRRGITIYGKDPEMVLSTMLWRMKDRVKRIDPYGYWLTEVPFPPAGYDPRQSELRGPGEKSSIFD